MLDKALPGATFPPTQAQAVTASDGVELPDSTKGIYVGGGGDLSLVLLNDTAPVNLVDVPAGVLLPLCVKKVMATGTTATDIVAFSGP